MPKSDFFETCSICGFTLQPNTEECPNCGTAILLPGGTPAPTSALAESHPAPASVAPAFQALIETGRNFQQQGKFAEALEAYRRARDLEPGTPPAVLEALIEAVEALSRRADSAPAPRLPAKEDEKAAREWLLRGRTAHEQKNYDEALRCFFTVIRLHPSLAEAYLARGDTRRMKRDLAGAMQDYNTAIQYNPEEAEAYYARGNVYYKQGFLDKAVDDYTNAIRLQPGHIKAYYNRGAIRSSRGDPEGAVKDYSEAIRLCPQYVEAYYNRALLWKKKNAYQLAINDLRMYLHLMGGQLFRNQAETEAEIRSLEQKLFSG